MLASKKRNPKPSRNKISDLRAGYAFVFPTVLVFALLILYPLVYGIYMSFFKTDLLFKWDFVGIKNFTELLTESKFLMSLVKSFEFAILVVIGHFVIGLLLGTSLNKKGRKYSILRGIFILPWLFPEAVIALVFKWIFNPIYGILNATLMQWGLINENISFLGDQKYAFFCVVMVCIWKGYPLILLMIHSGLQGIPEDLYEAAEIDGASKWRKFLNVTLPSLKPVLFVGVVLDTVWWFKHYTLVSVLTNGGPGDATSIISIDIFKRAFEYFDYGSAAAASVIVFVICYVLSKIYKRLMDNE